MRRNIHSQIILLTAAIAVFLCISQTDVLAGKLSTLTVVDPNGDESLLAGSIYTINWQSQGIISDVLIEYSSNNGSEWTVVEPTTPNTGSYGWLLPQVTSNQCLVRISDANNLGVSDVSDSVFTIYQCILVYDLNGDCKIDFKDVAVIAADWLNDCGNPYLPECTGNHPPQIISTPVTTVTQNVLYSYDVEGEDPDLWDELIYALFVSPNDMTIDVNTGLIEWTPTSDEVGDHNVVVAAIDTFDANGTQSFTITVAQYRELASKHFNFSGIYQSYTDYIYPPAGTIITDFRYQITGGAYGGRDNGTYIDTVNNRLVIKVYTGGYEDCWRDQWGRLICEDRPGYFSATYYIYEGDYPP